MPFQYALPNPGFGYQPQNVQPSQSEWFGPYYDPDDGSHVWSPVPQPVPGWIYQYARASGAKGWALPVFPGSDLWLRRTQTYVSGPTVPSNSGGGLTPSFPTNGSFVAGPWSVMCTAPKGARKWDCPRSVPYPPVPPSSSFSPPWGQVGQGFGLAQSYNFGAQPVAATPIGPWTGPFVVPGYEAYSSDLYSGAVYWMLKGDSAHWYRPQGFSFTVGNPQKPTGPAWWIRSPVGYGYPSEIMCSAMPGAQVWNCLAGDGHYPPVPPPPLKRIYNWA